MMEKRGAITVLTHFLICLSACLRCALFATADRLLPVAVTPSSPTTSFCLMFSAPTAGGSGVGQREMTSPRRPCRGTWFKPDT
ncbi:hypothetical protein B0T24DRAFT_632160 [Lasiosphaeria ovina]|uniref:Secreted protein n=1 Tax=Lasiosphaeria ovina TaxID=92902 RepID=A0AAE0N3U9_9PEZI|nr:hypothetical protein B0T24DRAFT_632160 [Lasiosphaeria ovina]